MRLLPVEFAVLFHRNYPHAKWFRSNWYLAYFIRIKFRIWSILSDSFQCTICYTVFIKVFQLQCIIN